jgi:hypothetical protein
MALWLDAQTLAVLKQARLKSESFSETILRLARTEQTDADTAPQRVSPENSAPMTKIRKLAKRDPHQREMLLPISGGAPKMALAKRAEGRKAPGPSKKREGPAKR